MKFYTAELELHKFIKHEHTLKEWAEYGINCIEYNGVCYYDGLKDGAEPIEEALAKKVFVLDYLELDDDGFIKAYIKES